MIVRPMAFFGALMLGGCVDHDAVREDDVGWQVYDPIQPHQCQGDGARFACAYKTPGYADDIRKQMKRQEGSASGR